MTISVLLLCGVTAGLIVGSALKSHKFGCIFLLAVPVAMIIYISQWQAAHPENLRSTSALDFLFGPLWPSAGAICGFYLARWIRASRNKQ